jgi:mannose-1-phosphate guanylyltransferase / mannose-6-phosphate isomerase
MKIVILTGGSGTRLWPLSQEEFPKQFLDFGDGESLLQKTLKRMSAFPIAEEIVLSTNIAYASLVQSQIEAIGLSGRCHVLIEPQRRNTAAAIALSVRYLEEKLQIRPEQNILVLPSDHFISPEEKFYHYLENASLAIQRGKIVLFGIKPYKPETGYGYVRIGPLFMDDIYSVEQFFEKPDLARAKEYFLRPDYFWNAGMFGFTPETFWRELREHTPEIYRLSQQDYFSVVRQFPQMPNISIDYALMEKSRQTAICPMELSWSDVGSWDNVYEVMKKDENQNVRVGKVLDIDTKNSLIIGGKRLIATIGLEDMLIVETAEAIFISKKGESQRVKGLISELASRKLEEAQGIGNPIEGASQKG